MQKYYYLPKYLTFANMKAFVAFRRVMTLVLLALFVVSCHKPEPREKMSVLIYMAGNNSLSFYAEDCIGQLKQGFIPSDSLDADNLLVYYHVPYESPKLVKYSRTTTGLIKEITLCTYPSDQNSATVETFRKVVQDAEQLCPAEHHSLIMWSHSSAFLPQGYYEKLWYNNLEEAQPQSSRILAQRNSFGKDYGSDSEMEISELAAALPFKYDYLIFDSCLMGCIEVAYEFRNKYDYLIVSPTEIMAQGFPYYMMMDQIYHNKDREAAATSIAKEYYEYYNKRNDGGTVTVVRSAALPALATSCATIIDRHREDIPKLSRNSLQYYNRSDGSRVVIWDVDLDHVMSLLATSLEYSQFSTVLDASIVYKAATKSFLRIPITHYSGYGMYLPLEKAVTLNDFYRSLAWNKAVHMIE